MREEEIPSKKTMNCKQLSAQDLNDEPLPEPLPFARAHCLQGLVAGFLIVANSRAPRLRAQPLTNTTAIYLRINTSVSVSYD